MSRGRRNSDGEVPPDLQAALNRLEKAVRDLADTATGEFVGRAASFIEETTTWLERELRGERSADDRRSARKESGHGSGARRAKRRRHGRRRARREESAGRAPSRKLYRDPKRAKIVGVCGGIANYFGAEVWVVRCVAVTGLIFMPSIVFPAYWILYFVMSSPPDREVDAGGAKSVRS